jgi:predicted RNA-binding protein Jag
LLAKKNIQKIELQEKKIAQWIEEIATMVDSKSRLEIKSNQKKIKSEVKPNHKSQQFFSEETRHSLHFKTSQLS